MNVDEQLREFRRGVVDLFPEEELKTRLREGRPLRIKLGVDPTAPDIHLGHTVPLTKLRRLQDLGHKAVLIIGDFTARVGDPSGRSATRPQLSDAEIERNAATYTDQVFKILDASATEVRRNSEWFGGMGLADVIRLASKITVARMLERDDFSKRYEAKTPIGLHEFLYPLMQGYDSVVIRSDVEIGGTDQTFNLLVGRDLQRDAGMPGQVAVVLPLLEGRDGTKKMSKSLDNHIGITDAPEDMFGKVMSITDASMMRYYELLSHVDEAALAAIRAGAVHPMKAKSDLAAELVARFWGPAAADAAAEHFRERFQHRRDHAPAPVEVDVDGEVGICDLLKISGLAPSSSEARRLVAQGAVRVDGEKVDSTFRFQVGKHRLVAVGRRRLVDVVRSQKG